MPDSADPLEDWPMDEVLQKLPAARNDIYGALYRYLGDLLTRFCKKTAEISWDIRLFHLDAVDLPKRLQAEGIGEDSFDRIEVSKSDSYTDGNIKCTP
jgi:hypothetical protein